MATAKLFYFDGRGNGSIIRLTLAACGIPFTEEILKEREQLARWRSDGKLLFDQVPMLEIDGLQLVQTGAIARYLARKGKLYGQTNEEAARIDMLFDGSRDFLRFFTRIGFVDEKEVLKEGKEKGLPRYLPIFDKVLKENGTGFLVGESLTLADIGLLEPLLIVLHYYGEDVIKDYPSLQKFHKTVTSLENISKFLSGPQRKRPNDDTYISTVKRVLDM